MKATKKEKDYSKKYYATHKSYREEKIEQRKKYAKSHRERENEYAREYYHSHENYKKKKQEWARNYKKKHYNKK